MKKKVLILISNELIVRNYITTNAFNLIKKKFECKFLINSRLVGYFKFNRKNIHLYKENEKESISLSKLIQRIIYNNKFNNPSFKFIADVYRSKIKLFFKGESFFKSIILFFKRLLALIVRNFYFYFQQSFFFKIKDNYFLKNFENNKDIADIIEKVKPKLIIFPFQSMEDEAILSIMKISKEKKIYTLGLIDNWDNMFTKPLIQPKPKFLTTWGEQGEKVAKSRHKYNKKNLFRLGTPRFDKYFHIRTKKLKSPFNFKYILFTEGWVWDELDEALIKLNSIIKNNSLFSKYKIIYRPHPWRKGFEYFDFNKYSNIKIDPQLEKNYKKKNFKTIFQPDLDYYPALIKNAELVISGPTSMIVESLIFRKKVLILSHNKKITYSHFNFIKKVENYKNIENVDSVRLCYDIDNIENDILKLFKKRINNNKIDKQRNYIFFKNKYKYEKNISNIAENIINNL